MPETLTIEPRLRKIIAEQFGVPESQVEPETNLRDDLRADSLDVIELVMRVEEEFGVDVTDEQFDGWNTTGDVLRTIEGKRHG